MLPCLQAAGILYAVKTKKRPAQENRTANQYVTTRAAARLCGVSIFSIQRWFDEGLLTGSTLPGGRRRISVPSINQFMRRHNMTPSTEGKAGLRRILLIDDDAKILSMMREGLTLTGDYVIRSASTGMEAGLAVTEFQPDCIVLDVMLEDVPGAQIVRRIRESQAGRGIRIVAISGKAEPTDVDEILGAGANAFLRKPFTIADLVKALESRRIVRK